MNRYITSSGIIYFKQELSTCPFMYEVYRLWLPGTDYEFKFAHTINFAKGIDEICDISMLPRNKIRTDEELVYAELDSDMLKAFTKLKVSYAKWVDEHDHKPFYMLIRALEKELENDVRNR